MTTDNKLADALRKFPEQWDRDAKGCERDGYMEAATVKADCARQLREALANHAASLAAPPAQREWVMVPREPTEAMIEAGFRWHGLAAYKAMIAAAPDAPAPVQPPANGDVDLEKVELWVANNCYDPVIEKTLFAAIAALQQPVLDATGEPQ